MCIINIGGYDINDLMKNLFKKTEFVFGVTSYKNLPEDSGFEILLAGRSNAGKSSALNTLTDNKKLARISKTPGRTTEINFFKVNEDLKLLDLPGYGFAKSSKAKKQDWGPLLGEYFQKRQALTAVIIFMDIRHPLKENDWEMINLCRDFDVPFIPVLTKSDKLSNNKIANTIQNVKAEIHEADALAISSHNGEGFDNLSTEILKFIP